MRTANLLTIFIMPKTIAMYGDSYVKRLKDYCDGDLRVPGTVYWFAKGGLRSDFKDRYGLHVDTDGKSNFERLKKVKPDVVFLNVGGNDLTSTTTPRQIYERVVRLVDELKRAGITDVYVAEILTRGDFSKSPDSAMNKTSFDLQRKKINTLLVKEYKEKLIRFPDIRYPADYTADLVHLMPRSSSTPNSGLNKYETRIRRILCSLKN